MGLTFPVVLSYTLGAVLLLFKCFDLFEKQASVTGVPELIRPLYARDLAQNRAFWLAFVVYVVVVLSTYFALSVLVSGLDESTLKRIFGVEKSAVLVVFPLYVATTMTAAAKVGEYASVETGFRRFLHRLASIPQAVKEFSDDLRRATFDLGVVDWVAASRSDPTIRNAEDWEAVKARLRSSPQSVEYAWLVVGAFMNSAPSILRIAAQRGASIEFDDKHQDIFRIIQGEFTKLRERLSPDGNDIAPQAFRNALALQADSVFALEEKLYLYLACLLIRQPGALGFRKLARALSFSTPSAGATRVSNYDALITSFACGWLLSFIVLLSLLVFESRSAVPNGLDDVMCAFSVQCFTHGASGFPSLVGPHLRGLLISNIMLILVLLLPLTISCVTIFQKVPHDLDTLGSVAILALAVGVFVIADMFFFVSRLIDYLVDFLPRWKSAGTSISDVRDTSAVFDIRSIALAFVTNGGWLRGLPYALAAVAAGIIIDRSKRGGRVTLIGLLSAFGCVMISLLINYLVFTGGCLEGGAEKKFCPQYGAIVSSFVRDVVFFLSLFFLIAYSTTPREHLLSETS